ncbi:hypothetical protein C7M84_016509 [Penaeus vannamei]|uniref:Glucosylceramidase n=1 Tax=Penaeus vannamei TaxID=6689 RepID=A0A423SN09_PENVA|nr:hypothetical protein C7M84_016509 [Penaeus vannamei]
MEMNRLTILPFVAFARRSLTWTVGEGAACPARPCDVFFLKTHKTASSVVQNLLLRWGARRGLVFGVPGRGVYLGHPKPFTSDLVRHTPLICKSLSKDAVWITIMRDPSTSFQSMFSYYNLEDEFHTPLLRLLDYPRAQMNAFPRYYGRVGRNQVLFDLGVEPEDFDSPGVVEETIRKVEQNFHLVMVAEYMDESLILLKDLLGLRMRDAVTLRQKVRLRPGNASQDALDRRRSARLRDWLRADHQLHRHFTARLLELVGHFGRARMAKEVAELRALSEVTRRKCGVSEYAMRDVSIKSYGRKDLPLLVGYRGSGSSHFCRALVKPNVALTKEAVRRQFLRYFQYYFGDKKYEFFPEPYGADSVVCVCSSDYCDFPGVLQAGPAGTYTSVTSSRDGLRFHVESGSFSQSPSNASVVVHVDDRYEYQAIMGFGGAFTDAAGINIDSLPEVTQEVLLRSYFSPEGLEYNLCRVPIGGSDFSTRPYSYDDVEGDVELSHFNLTLEDYRYKLPYIRRAKELSEKEFMLFGSPWSPPAWMKENGHFNGSGGLLKEMWQPWSNYFVKFVKQYEAEGAPLWGLTTQNEPLTGFEEDYPWNTCAWTAEDQRDWIKQSLGPTLEEAGLRRLKLMVPDHSRNALPWYPATVGSYAPPGERVVLGDWSRAEHYAYNIIEEKGEFYKQPMFYALGHFSKVLVPGSRRVYASVSSPSDTVSVTAFHNPADNTSAVVILNSGDAAEAVSVGVGVGGGTHFINVDIPAKAITSLLFAPPEADGESGTNNGVF